MAASRKNSWIERLSTNDDTVLEEILSTFGAPIRAYLRRKFHPALRLEEFEEVLNLALLRIWQNRQHVRKVRSFGAWFRTIAHHIAFHFVQCHWAQMRQMEVSMDPVRLDTLDARRGRSGLRRRDGKAGTNHKAADMTWLSQSLQQLPEIQQYILLSDAQAPDGRASCRDLAEQLNLDPRAVPVYRKRALERLRAALASHTAQHPGGAQTRLD